MAPSGMYLAVKLFTVLHLINLLAESGRAVACSKCNESLCEEPKNCPGSTVLDICGCCSICAKQKNENCGGWFGVYGTCDHCLQCVNDNSITGYKVEICEESCEQETIGASILDRRQQRVL